MGLLSQHNGAGRVHISLAPLGILILMDVWHFDVEEESLAGERMVEIQKYGVVFYLFYNGSNE
jgi:hypothetical protein